MFKKKFLLITSMIAILLITNSNIASAEIDYSKNEAYYDKICSVRPSYTANKQACDDYEIYKIEKSGKTSVDLETELKNSRLNAEKLAYMVRKSDELLIEKEAIIASNTKKLAENKVKAARLEEDIEAGLINMQEFSNPNASVDFVMGAANIEELVLRVEGLKVLNDSNVDMLIELDEAKKEIETLSSSLTDDVVKIKKVRESQVKLLNEYRLKESTAYASTSQTQPVTYNDDLDTLDFTNAEDKAKSWKRPVQSTTISAGAWAYPGGGWHPGVDMASPIGTPIMSPGAGYLLAYGQTASGYGIHSVLIFQKGSKVYTMIFAHMKQYEIKTQFNQGDTLGFIGLTGTTTGPHVHVEVFEHNTNDIKSVINKYKSTKDYYFGLGYNSKGNCSNVCRLNPQDFFGVKVGSVYK